MITWEQYHEMVARTEKALAKFGYDLRKEIPDEHPNPSPVPHPKSECIVAPTLGCKAARTVESLARIIIRFTGYRTRPLDPDSIAAGTKDLLDGLRHAGLIPGDEPWVIKLETQQVKVPHLQEECTVIEIEGI